MPDARRHRGQHPKDTQLFAPSIWPRLHEAVADYSWLLSREYASASALQLVGNRYQLAERQLKAIMRCVCSDASLKARQIREVDMSTLQNQPLLVDGYNVLTTVEVALSGGMLFLGRDGCLRDIASMHGTFRTVEETVPALKLIGNALQQLEVIQAVWYLDSPVSNSGRLKTLISQIAQQYSWNWNVELVFNPDAELKQLENCVASADGVILENCHHWFNLSRFVIEKFVAQSIIVDLSPGTDLQAL